jgi:hypothetical protein
MHHQKFRVSRSIHRNATKLRALLLLSVLVTAGPTFVYAQKPSADEIIAKHRASFGSAEDIAKTKLRSAVGSGQFQNKYKPNKANFAAYFASNGDDLKFLLTMELWTYRNERIGVFSNKINIPYLDPNQRHGPLSDFLSNYDPTLTDRIFGGPVFSRWVFLSSTPPKGKFETEGKKKIGDRETWVVKYHPKNELTLGASIKLYFDAENFRLLRTEYRESEINPRPFNAGSDTQTASGTVYPSGSTSGETIIEDFGDYRPVAGVMLPHKYIISPTMGNTFLFEYSVVINEYKILNEFPADTFTFQTAAKTH